MFIFVVGGLKVKSSSHKFSSYLPIVYFSSVIQIKVIHIMNVGFFNAYFEAEDFFKEDSVT